MSNRTICLINDSFPPVTDGVANAVVNYGRAITESGSRAVVLLIPARTTAASASRSCAIPAST